MYFNVPGSLSRPAMAVYDVLSRLKCPVVTINAGLTVGMGALLCAAGTRGKRYALPNSRFLMSRSGLDEGIEGQAADIHLQVEEVPFLMLRRLRCAAHDLPGRNVVSQVLKSNAKATRELARLCDHPLSRLESDLRRDFYLTAAEASSYGLIDQVLLPAQVGTNRAHDVTVITQL
jgi:ATP-dependent Clp protease protease subunit